MSVTSDWTTCCWRLPGEQIVLFVQVIISYVVIIVSLVNMIIDSPNLCSWSNSLSVTLGYILPSPKSCHHDSLLRNTPV
jgi:hypothetical protein